MYSKKTYFTIFLLIVLGLILSFSNYVAQPSPLYVPKHYRLISQYQKTGWSSLKFFGTKVVRYGWRGVAVIESPAWYTVKGYVTAYGEVYYQTKWELYYKEATFHGVWEEVYSGVTEEHDFVKWDIFVKEWQGSEYGWVWILRGDVPKTPDNPPPW